VALNVANILAELDTEITRLQHIRAALTGIEAPSTMNPAGKKRGRPKGSKNTATAGFTASKSVGKRQLSPEGRKRIAEAMKKRWAEKKKAA
jgi:hypothetical protein